MEIGRMAIAAGQDGTATLRLTPRHDGVLNPPQIALIAAHQSRLVPQIG